jgi:hypothetical protein
MPKKKGTAKSTKGRTAGGRLKKGVKTGQLGNKNAKK